MEVDYLIELNLDFFSFSFAIIDALKFREYTVKVSDSHHKKSGKWFKVINKSCAHLKSNNFEILKPHLSVSF